MALMVLLHCAECGETFYGSLGLIGKVCGGSTIREVTEAERAQWYRDVAEGDALLEGME